MASPSVKAFACPFINKAYPSVKAFTCPFIDKASPSVKAFTFPFIRAFPFIKAFTCPFPFVVKVFAVKGYFVKVFANFKSLAVMVFNLVRQRC